METTTKAEITGIFRAAENRLVLLDYDGTLVDYAPLPADAVPTKDILDVLTKLSGLQNTTPIIISGRSHKEIEKMLGHLPITMIAEHGAMVRDNGEWRDQINDKGQWKNDIISMLRKVTLECPGSYIEEKRFSLAWHYRNSDPASGYVLSRELIRQARTSFNGSRLKVLDGNKVVEIMAGDHGKGEAVRKITGKDKFDFILAIGDDATDEEIFELLLYDTDAYTVKVGDGKTKAKYKLDSVRDVLMFIKELSG